MTPSNSLPGLNQWRQVSFVLFDLGAMNLIAGAILAFSLSSPLYLLGFHPGSFWLGLIFVLAGLASWKIRRLPVIVPLLIIVVDLWNTLRILPLFDRAGYVVLVQSSFVLPLVFLLISILRARFKQGLLRPVKNNEIVTTPGVIHSGKEALALLTSMLASIGAGLAGLLLFSNYCVNQIAEANNAFINIFHDLLLVPALLLMFPLNAALGELIWIRLSRFYLNRREIANVIRYLKQIPLMSRLAEHMLQQHVEVAYPGAAFSPCREDQVQRGVVSREALALTSGNLHLSWFVPLALLVLTTGLTFVYVSDRSEVSHVEAIEETSAEPGMLVVSQSGRGQYRTIGAAVTAADAGKTILVREGEYHESLLIDKPITLMADEKAVGRVTIECEEGICLRLAADCAVVRNLRINARVGFWRRFVENVEASAIAIVSGNSVVENCEVLSNSGTGIVVSNAQPEIRQVSVHDCRLNGVLFTNQSGGLLEDSDIKFNGWAGIRSEDKSRPLVRRTRIYSGRMDGVLIAGQGEGTFENCEVFENNFNGIHAREGSLVNVFHTKVFQQKSVGILVRVRSSAHIEDCDVFGNRSSGIEISDQSNAQVVKSKIHNGLTRGITFASNSTGTVVESLIYENIWPGLWVDGASNPVIRKSIFRSHDYMGVEVNNGSDPIIEQCQIFGGRSNGIAFHNGSRGSVEECSIFGNMDANITIDSGSNPHIQKTRLSESRQAGLMVTNGGRGLIEDCKIANNYVGVEIQANGAPTIQHCQINTNRSQAVAADAASAGSITDSNLTANRGGAWKVDTRSALFRGQNVE